MKIVLASNNTGKIREFSHMLADFAIELIPQRSLGIENVEETGLSFVENAIIKARHAAKLSGLPALADDSGLAITALRGAPGIYSARYAGIKSDDKRNVEKVLLELSQVSDNQRQAEFHCALAFMLHDSDPVPLICEGSWQGIILRQRTGEHGFGYDPIFYVPDEKKSAAELPPEIKNRISHRGKALQHLLKQLPEKLHDGTLR